MHTIHVVYYIGASQTFLYGNEEAEDAKKDFAILKGAMDDYRKFKNDTLETVTLSGKHGETVFRTEYLISVNISNIDTGEANQLEWAASNGRISAAHAAAKEATLTPAERTP